MQIVHKPTHVKTGQPLKLVPRPLNQTGSISLTLYLTKVDAVAVMVGHRRTCDLEVTGSSPAWAPLRSGLEAWASYLHVCASTTKLYSFVPAKGSDFVGWKSNRGPGGK